MVVIGSGYGASIAASRCARAGQSVCVLERGKEWLPGDFPETFRDISKHVQIKFGGKGKKIGMAYVEVCDETVLLNCGYANKLRLTMTN